MASVNTTLQYMDLWEVTPWGSAEAARDVKHHEHLTLALVHTLLALWAGLANVTQIVTLLQDGKLRRQPRSALIVSISVSELLMACFLCPLYTDSLVRGPWKHGLFLCSLYEAVFYLQVCVSSLAMLMFNMERLYFMAAPHLLQSPSRRCHVTALLTSLPWILGVMVVVPLFTQGAQAAMMQAPGHHHHTCVLQWDRTLHIVTVFVSFLAPSFLMLATAVSVLLLYVFFSIRAHHEEHGLDSRAPSPVVHHWSDSEAGRMSGQASSRRRRHFSGLQEVHWKLKKECVLSVCASTFLSVGLQFPFFILLLLQEFCQQQPSNAQSSPFSLLPETSHQYSSDPSNCQFSDMVWAVCMAVGMAKSGLLPLVWLLYSDIRAGFSPKVCGLSWRRCLSSRRWWWSSLWSTRRRRHDDCFESDAGYAQSQPSLSSQMTIV